MRNHLKNYLAGCLLFFLLILLSGSFNTLLYRHVASLTAAAFNPATDTDAKIASGFAWSDTVGWINFGEGTDRVTGRAYVSNDKLYGYAWGENVGWISLSCENDDSCGTVDYGVSQDPSKSGILTGYAWGENIGWIDFAPDGSGVTISTSTSGTNAFSGYAWGENIGWISFSGDDYGVTTEWTRHSGGGAAVPPPACIYDDPDWGACTASSTQTRTLTAMNQVCLGEDTVIETRDCVPETAVTASTTAAISLSVSTTSVNIYAGENISFTAAVSGTTTNSGVLWTIFPIENIVADYYGTLSRDAGASTTYTAPSDLYGLTSLSLQVIATAQADATKKATVNIIVNKRPLCSAYAYSNWGACINDVQTRTVLSSQPANCQSGTTPTTSQACTIIPTATTTPCINYSYSDWSDCINGNQTRTTLSSDPAGCLGGNSPVNSRTCSIEPLGITDMQNGDTEQAGNSASDSRSSHSGGSGGSNGGLLTSLSDGLSSFISNNAIVLGTTTEKIVSDIKKIVESPVGSTVTNTITTAGVIGGGVAASSVLVLNGATAADILFLPFKLWGLLLSILGLKKRNRPWGTVYDSVTKQPIDPAYVTIAKVGTKEENTSITDLDGRYGFLTSPGRYLLSANKTNYAFPSKKLAGQTADTLYNNLYFGEEIEITEANALISKNIPLDPLKFDWNEFVKGQKKLMKFYSKRDKLIRIVTDWVFRIGFVISLLSLFLVSAPYNLVIFGLYIILAVLRKSGLKPKALGSLTDKSGDPLSFAIIRVFSADLKVEITNKVADKIGRYYCLVPKGRYYMKVEKKNDDESYSEIFTSPVFEAKDGIVDKSFVV